GPELQAPGTRAEAGASPGDGPGGWSQSDIFCAERCPIATTLCSGPSAPDTASSPACKARLAGGLSPPACKARLAGGLSPPAGEEMLTASLSTQIALRRHRLGILISLMRVLPVDASALSTATPAALPIAAPRRESSIRMKKHPLNYVGYPAPLSVAEARARGATDYDIRS